MSLSQIKINGIRLGSRQNLVIQTSVNGRPPPTPLYEILTQDRINIVSLGVRINARETIVFCCHDVKSDVKSDKKFKINRKSVPADSEENFPIIVSDVCTISVYPHNGNLYTMGVLMALLGKQKIKFQLVSSHAMISFIIARFDQEKVLAFLEKEFDLSPTHTPFEQNYDGTYEFVKKRYPETRATYVEEKIKTYGIKLDTQLEMLDISFNPNQQNHLDIFDNGLQNFARSGVKFHFVTAMTLGHDLMHLYCLTDLLPSKGRQSFHSQVQETKGMIVCPFASVDLISFHGPHFGDRFGIFNMAMACLNAAAIPVLLAGCTGASICIALPATLGEKAVPALARGFESP